MKKQNSKPEEAAQLRQKAEELLQRRDKAYNVSTNSTTEPDLLKLIYELEVHQIELEMQNEELVIAKEKAEKAEEKYTDLYDFASSGYMTLSKNGEILELNFAAAQMLGKERSHLINKRFDFFVSIDTQTTFNLFLSDVFTSKVKLSCEAILATEGNLPIYVNIDGIVSQNNELCLLTLNDITESKKSAINLFEAKELAEESEIRFRNLSENSPAIIYRILLNPSFKFEYVSPAVTKITGYTPEDHYADPDLGFKLVHPDDRIILENSTHKTQGEPVILRWVKKDGKIIWTEQRNVLIFDSEGNPFAIEGIATDITVQKEAEQRLKRIEWLLTSRPKLSEIKEQTYMPPYGDLVALNASRLILDSVGEQTLTDIVGDYLNLLDTSSAVYEKNGDYALGIFSSGWCRFMDTASRKVCGTDDNREALECGRWHCHESCWSRASKTAIESGQPADIECDGGIRLYAAPIRVGDDIVGAINFGYGDPPRDERKLQDLATLYQVSYDELRTYAFNYESRPPYIVDLAKNRLLSSARLIGEIIERKQAEKEIKKTGQHYQALIEKAPDGIALIDAEGNFKYISPAAKKMFGYLQTDEVTGNPADYTHPNDVQMVMYELGKILENPAYIPTLEYRFIDKSGKWHWVETTFSNLLAYSSVESIVLNFRDTTEQKLMADTQRFLLQISNPESDDTFFESLAKYLSQCLDMEYVCIDLLEGDRLNAKTLAIYNEGNFDPNVSYALKDTPCGEVVGNHICCYPQEVRSLFPNDTALNDIKAESYIGTTLWSFDGQPIGLIALIGQKPLQNQELAASVLKLVSLRAAGKLEATLADEKVRESEEKFRLLYESMDQGLALHEIILDENGNPVDYRFLDINDSYTRILGVTREMSIGKRIREVMPKVEQYWIDVFGKVALTGESNYYENYLETTGKYYSTYSYCPKKNQFAVLVTDITERKLAEEKLRKSEERYALVIDASEQGIWDWNVETNEIFYSEQWKKQIGYEDDELKNEFNTWVEHLHPDEREYCQNAVYSYLKQPVEHFILDFRLRHKDGTYRWIHNKAASIKNLEGKVIRLFGSHTDITETKLSEAIFKDIIEKNPMSIQILDMEGYPIQVNPAHTRLFGVEIPPNYSVFEDSQLLDLGFGELFDRIRNGEVVNFPDSFYNVHDVDSSFPDSPAWVKALGFTLNDNNGKPNKIVLMHENITDRKNAEALLNDIIENNPLSIQVVDKEGYTLRGNPAFIELFGSVPPPQFSIFEDLKSKSTELGNLVSLVKKGEIVHLPDTYFNPHDTVSEAPDIPLWIRALIFPLKDSSGKPERFVFMHENITERKFAEQELIKAKEHAEESDRLKSAFLANMSHEIRTPMNGILGFSELLKEPGLTGEQQQKYIRIIEKSGARMLNIINDIIDISKIESGLIKLDISESNVNEQIEFIYTFFKPEVEAKGIKLSFRNTLSAKEALIKTDREKLYAILTNLVKNAIKYTNEGSIEFGYNLVEALHATSLPLLQFFVKDTGIGIPKDRQEAIFQRFIQADITDKMARQGAGLGLSISKAYVEMLGGKIWVESDPNSEQEGIGSTFYFTLPYHAETEKENMDWQPDPSEKNESARKLKMLIAEDDEVSEMLIDSYIKMFGKEILKAKTGVEAVEVCRDNPDIDLILMDIRMPEMGGYEATKQIRQFNENVVILAQTAFGLSGDREKAIKAGCNDYIAKPINKNELQAMIKKYFKK